MRRIVATLAAIMLILGVGAISVGAVKDFPPEELVVDVTVHLTLDESSFSFDDFNQYFDNYKKEKEFVDSELMLSFNGATTPVPIKWINGQAVAETQIRFQEGNEEMLLAIEFSPISHDTENLENLFLFNKINHTETVIKGTAELTIDLEVTWSSLAKRLYEAKKRGADWQEIVGIFAQEGDVSESAANLVQKIMQGIGDYLSKFSISYNMLMSEDQFASEELNAFIERVYDIMYPIAFLLMIIIWLVSVAKSAVSTDLWNKENFIKPLLRLVWSVAIMTLSIPLLELIYSVFHMLAMEAFGAHIGDGMQTLFDILEEESSTWIDDSWIVGGIMTFINVILKIPKILIFVVFEIIFSVVFYVIVAIRFIKLATMQCISPFFFACVASEKTERYLQSFLREYIVYSAQILVAMAMYTILISIYVTATASWAVLGSVLGLIMYLAGIIAVSGSGKFLRSLLQ